MDGHGPEWNRTIIGLRLLGVLYPALYAGGTGSSPVPPTIFSSLEYPLPSPVTFNPAGFSSYS